jgi:glycosyltransferase involved in cell wall biosynthesis
LRAYGLSARVCRLGVDVSLFHDHRLKRERTVIGVGAIVPAKAIERTITAVAAVSTDRPRLEWIGNVADADYRRQLDALATDRKVEIAFSVNLPDQELVSRLNRASAMVYAPRLEPFGFAPLEASACGLPIVGIAEAGIRETVRDGFNGLLIEDGPTAMAAAIERILGDPVYGRTLGANGRSWVCEEWTADQAVGRLEEALVEVTSNPVNRR